MPDWQERITSHTEPALRVEHEVRYRLAAPLLAHARAWCDLGCGNGVAAADALGEHLPEHVVLVDVDEHAVAAARETLGKGAAIAADLTSPEDLGRVREALLDGGGERVVTCFEVIEHLENFVPLVEALAALARDGEATVLLSVPNDEFWAIDNPHHHTMWGAGAFEELRRLLPDGALIARQTSLQGSAVVLDGAPASYQPAAEIPADGLVPTHFLAAFGPRAAEIAGGAAVTAVDLDEERRWVRQRESDLAYAEVAMRELAELRALAATVTEEREQWRRYIHELEDRLGIPRAGTPEATRNALPSG